MPQYPVKKSAIKIFSEVASGAGLISSLFLSSTVQSGVGGLGAGSPSATNTRDFVAGILHGALGAPHSIGMIFLTRDRLQSRWESTQHPHSIWHGSGKT